MTKFNLPAFIERPSPNFDERVKPVRFVVLHYTGMESGPAAIDWLCNPISKVSSHYVVEENGDIYQLVPDAKRAWHAGRGSWRGETDVNGVSVGIEIVNGGHEFGLPEYPEAQIRAVMALVDDLLERHGLDPRAVIGHSDLAPSRKPDPGEKFPWARLVANNLAIGADPVKDGSKGDHRPLFDVLGMVDRGVAVLQTGLATIGYGVEVTGVYDQITFDTVTAFQRRHRQSNPDGIVDVETLGLVNAVVGRLKRA